MSEQELTVQEIKKKIRNLEVQQSRLKLKEDPVAYQESLAKQRIRSRNYWASLTPEQKAEKKKRDHELKKLNPERTRATTKKSYYKNRDKILAKKKLWRDNLTPKELLKLNGAAVERYKNLPEAEKIELIKKNHARNKKMNYPMYKDTRPFEQVKNCLACGLDFLIKARAIGATKYYCSKKCMYLNVKAKGIIENIQFNIFNPIYQAKQLGLIEIRTKQIRITEKEVVFL